MHRCQHVLTKHMQWCCCADLNRGPVRSVAWAEGGQGFATVSHPFMESNGFIFVYDTPDGAEPCEFETIASLEIPIPNKEKVSVLY
jgi:hypothetical protein